MPDEKEQKKVEEPKVEEPTYHFDRLVADSHDFFGEPPHVLAGALHGERKKNFTLAEAKRAIADFKKRKVATSTSDAD